MGKNVLVSMAAAVLLFAFGSPQKKNEEFSSAIKKMCIAKDRDESHKIYGTVLWYPVRRSRSLNLMHFSFLVISALISCTILCGSQKSFGTIINERDAIDFNRLDFLPTLKNSKDVKMRLKMYQAISSTVVPTLLLLDLWKIKVSGEKSASALTD